MIFGEVPFERSVVSVLALGTIIQSPTDTQLLKVQEMTWHRQSIDDHPMNLFCLGINLEHIDYYDFAITIYLEGKIGIIISYSVLSYDFDVAISFFNFIYYMVFYNW